MMDGQEKSDPAIASAERRMSQGLKPPALGWGAPYPKTGIVLRYPKGEEGMESLSGYEGETRTQPERT
jgi:hypothetical protein